MFRAILSTLILLSVTAVSLAETRYISDRLSQPLREEPCSDCAVRFQVPAGAEVELIETDAFGWAQVRTAQGQTGWLPSGQLMFRPAARDLLEELEARIEALHVELGAVQQQLQVVTAERDQIREDLINLRGEEGDRYEELVTLRQQAEHAANLIDQNQELLKNNNMLQGRIDVLTASNEQLQSSRNQTWFLYGAMAMFLAAILAALLPRLKPRKRFSEWA